MKLSMVLTPVAIMVLAGCATQCPVPEWKPSEGCVMSVSDPMLPEDTRAALVVGMGGQLDQEQLRQFTRISRYGTDLRKAAIRHIEDRKLVERFANESGDPVNSVAVKRLEEMDSCQQQKIVVTADILAIVLDDLIPYEMRFNLMRELAPFYTQEQLSLLAHLKHHEEIRSIALEHLNDSAYLAEVSENKDDDLAKVAAERLDALNAKK